MPPAWTDKDERQFKEVKKSALRSGKSDDQAAELAARVVNKHRREEGRTPNKTTQGTGNPNRSLDDRPVTELRNLASQLKIEGRSKMRKQELVRAIRDKR